MRNVTNLDLCLLCALAFIACDDGDTNPPPDMHVVADAGPDGATADMASDGPLPDGPLPDMATPDMATPDMATPDMATPDMATPDMAPDGPPPADGDEDGEPDATDNCPNHYNPGQDDADANNTGDACDGDVIIHLALVAADAGDTITVAVTAEEDLVGIGSVTLEFTNAAGVYALRDQNEVPPGIEIGADAAAAMKTATNQAGAGGARVLTVSALNFNEIMDGDNDGAKTLATLGIDVDPAAAAGDHPLQISVTEVTDAAGNSVAEFAVAPGVIRIP